MVKAALQGELDEVAMRVDPYFGLQVPEHCFGVPSQVLDPCATWKDRPAYEQKARELAAKFEENFKNFAPVVSSEVTAAGPVAER
jgi:phosphoenolpyruvate carboxykinase (ATP)